MYGALGTAILAIAACFILPLLIALHFTRTRRFGDGLVFVLVLFLGFAGLGILQLLPLGGLAERPLVDTIREWAGLEPQRTLSLDPGATLRFIYASLFPLCAALALLGADETERRITLCALVSLAVASSLIALLQLAVGAAFNWPVFLGLESRSAGGFFANVNHQGLFQALSLVAAAIVLPKATARNQSRIKLLVAALIVSALLAAFVGGSQAGVLFVGIAALVLVRKVFAARLGILTAGTGSALMLGFALGALVPGTSNWFESDSVVSATTRLQFWKNSAPLMVDVAPWGSGLGTYASMYRTVEPLSQLFPAYVNHAHNEPIEFMVEAGVPGLLFIVVATGAYIRTYKRTSGQSGQVRLLSLIGLALIGAHSLIDYALRTEAIAVIALTFLLIPFNPRLMTLAVLPRRRGWGMAAGVTVGGFIATYFVAPPLIAQLHLEADRPISALRFDPDNAQALTLQALSDASRDPTAAVRDARAAFDRAPLSPDAAALLLLDPEQYSTADRQLLNQLGWRSSPMQTFLFLAAVEAGEDEEAAKQLTALAKRRKLPPVLANVVRPVLKRPAFVAALDEHGTLDDASLLASVITAPFENELEGQVHLLTLLGERGPVRPAFASATFTALLAADRDEEAVALFRTLYPGRFALSVHPYWQGLSVAERTPFDPALSERQGVRVSRADMKDGLRISGRLATRRDVAARHLPIGSGQLQMSYKVDGRRGTASVTPRLVCDDSRELDVETALSNDGRISISVDVPKGCAAPIFSWRVMNPGGRFDIRLLEPRFDFYPL
ncbi:O-antigen ligase family protein [Sphingomicrobium aestuariivivum]|nr:O-antigen ligase family protein [Sphingomicrobium aestuariivivum]MCJ8192033.1 O-antigen ligase family protein [Sphingomicrobium aestuariivivum]